MQKQCSICKEYKNLETEFHIRKERKHGYTSSCKVCKIKQDRTSNLKRLYNIDMATYEQMLQSQNGVCKICKNKETMQNYQSNRKSSLAVDHCHKTGKVRGLLCSHCNTSIGRFKENINILKAAIDYLEEYNAYQELDNHIKSSNEPYYFEPDEL